MLRRQRAELAIHHERWLVSYADFMTLLFGFFVVMYAVSNMHEQQYKELSDTLTKLFAVTEQPSNQTADLLNQDIVSRETLAEKKLPAETLPIVPLSTLSLELKEKFSDLLADESVNIVSDERELQLSLNNKLLFSLGSVQPNQQAHIIIEEVANILKDFSNSIQVEGFTDNLSINTERFPSNWELSSIRAVAILKLLITHGVSPQNLSAVGYGEFQAIADNSTAAGRAQNRRVVIKIAQKPRTQQVLDTTDTDKSRLIEEKLNRDQAVTNERHKDTQQAGKQVIESTQEGIAPIILDNGELLFTNDPDLPRKPR